MRAIVYETGGVESLAIQNVPDPQPQEGDVLVRVKACAMNHLDVLATMNAENRRTPRIMGCDVAGVVESLGPGVTGFSSGDRVVVAPGISCGRCTQCQLGKHADCSQYKLLGVSMDGGYAELVSVPAVNLVPLPEGISFEDGACLPVVYITSWRAVVEKANVQPGEWVLVTAAGSGLGIAAVQIARLFGARVIAAAGSEAKREKALGLGAEGAVDYTQSEWPQEVVRLADGVGADIAIETVGGATLSETLGAMATDGHIVNCGFTAGTELDIDPATFRRRRLSLTWISMGSNGYLHEVMKFVKTGRIRPVVHQVFPFEQIQDAHRAMINRDNFGKIVLRW